MPTRHAAGRRLHRRAQASTFILMKTLLKLAVGAAVAGAVVNLLLKRTSRPFGTAPLESVPVETLNDSAGTPASAIQVQSEFSRLDLNRDGFIDKKELDEEHHPKTPQHN
jgi:hypothetical protein